MTTTIKREVLLRKRPKLKRGDQPLGLFALDLADFIQADQATRTGIQWPDPAYQDRPVEFFQDILGVQPWSRQKQILELVRDNKRVAVCSGHKVSKSHTAAGLALWFYCSFQDARVVMSSTTSRQVDQILWRELRMMRARGGRCVVCKAADPDGHVIPRPCDHSALILEEPGILARTGIKSADFREVVGFTAREAEAVAGISGRNLMYILDEASGIPDVIFEAIEGNRAGGARCVMFSNGTRNEGEFYEAFNAKAAFYKTLRISSEETPNVVQRKLVIPGLAEWDWIQEKRLEWGEDSALYKVRIKGEHATAEEHKIFSMHLIEQAEQRWAETPESGRLFIGLDPAGDSGEGDETVIAVRRGLKLIALLAWRGLTDDQHLAHVIGTLGQYRLPRETPVVVLDREGPVGASLYGLMRQYVALNPKAFELIPIRVSDGAQRQPKEYDRLRDELAANLKLWFRDGGAIVEDTKLEKDLHALEFNPRADGKYKLIAKDKIRKLIGRSPDRYDALALCAWEPLSLRDVPANDNAKRAAANDNDRVPVLDPFAAQDAWGRR